MCCTLQRLFVFDGKMQGMSTERRRLLIVNNDERESAVLVNLASSMGYEAASTWSGWDALATLSSNRFDFLLVDQYVADMYVGDFIERVLRSSNSSSIALMKDRTGAPVKYDKSLGRCREFDKEQLGQLVQALRADVLASSGQVN
jgi:hypothetical protein